MKNKMTAVDPRNRTNYVYSLTLSLFYFSNCYFFLQTFFLRTNMNFFKHFTNVITQRKFASKKMTVFLLTISVRKTKFFYVTY